ncbi:MAG: hypothetical protein JXE07_02040 [Candidatus Aminicenantes bacterium]|nr:hypothetical protein [Candidatus Aminicenantes bacterium]
MSRREKQSRYYQEIARAFFVRRGAPYVLSSQDMVTISSWEEARIPLQVVLDGIERVFERAAPRRAQGRRLFSLSSCRTEVAKAHAEFRDRRVGRGRKDSSRDDKRKKVRSEVRRFLDSLPPEAEFLRETYHEALAAVSRKNVVDETLERLDEKIETLILRTAEAGDRGKMKMTSRPDVPGRPGAPADEIFRIRLLKRWREEFRIPYVSFFYY